MQTVTSPLGIEAAKQLVDQRLADYITVRTVGAQRVGERYVLFWEAVGKLIEKGGKRFRPYMLLTAFDAYSNEDADKETIIPAAIAQELIHLAMLIHDDIIDRDTVRYGIKNIAGQYDTLYKPLIKNRSERTHMSQSVALLAGDILISDAYRLLSHIKAKPTAIVQATSILSNGVFDVVGGELLDTESAFFDTAPISAERIARFKTAGYSFISPLVMGAVLAGAPNEDIHHIEALGEALGIGYQLRDDILGIFGDEAATGKSASSDITEGKRTYLVEQFQATASLDQKAVFNKVFHNAAAKTADIKKAREVLIESGALAEVEKRIKALSEIAQNHIEALNIDTRHKQVFLSLVKTCLQRAA